jgi:hypothetical protein
MSKHRILFASNIVFWIALVASAGWDLSLSIANRNMPAAALLILFAVPILILFSWRAAYETPSNRLRAYYMTFRWLGCMLWVLCLWLTWIHLGAMSQAESTVNHLLRR